MKESQKKPKPRPKNFSKKNLPLDKSPVDDSQISVREFKPKHTYDVHRIVYDWLKELLSLLNHFIIFYILKYCLYDSLLILYDFSMIAYNLI